MVNELMDIVYTEPQAITITQPDERTKQELINQWIDDKKTGKRIIHLFGGDADYGIVITTGDAYPTQMAQAADKLLSLSQQFPGPMQQCLDLLVTDLYIPGALQYVERLRTILNIKSDEDGNQPTMQQLQAQIAQLGQVNQQAHGLLQQAMQKISELGSEEAIKRLKIASDERKAAATVMGTLAVQEMKDRQAGAHSVLLASLEQIVKQLDMAADVQQEAAATEPQTPGGAAPHPSTPAPPQGSPPQAQPPQGAPPGGPAPQQVIVRQGPPVPPVSST